MLYQSFEKEGCFEPLLDAGYSIMMTVWAYFITGFAYLFNI